MPDKNKILKALKSNKNLSSIRLPSKIKMEWNNDSILMSFNSELVSKNMQDDNTAFEGWAVIIKRWIPIINKIIISWDSQSDTADSHYQRFLYRVVNFKKLFDWFEVDDKCSVFLAQLDYGKQGVNYIINIPGKRNPPDHSKFKDISSVESAIESFIYNISADLEKLCNLKFLDRQLPVGVFKDEVKNGSEVFTKGKSAIDLWGVTSDNKLSIFELKNSENRKAGIISEILFYSYVIRDIQNNLINLPYKTKDNNILSIKQTKGIISYFLVPALHPLIDNNIIKMLNNVLAKNDIEIKYIKISDSVNGKLVYNLQ